MRYYYCQQLHVGNSVAHCAFTIPFYTQRFCELIGLSDHIDI